MATGLSTATRNCIVVRIQQVSEVEPYRWLVLTNFSLQISNVALENVYYCFNILESVKGLGVTVGEEISQISGGTINIEDVEGSAGLYNRFFDFFKTYYNQFGLVYVDYYSSPEEARHYLDSSTNVNPVNSKTIFTGELNGYSYDAKQGNLKINITKEDLANRILTYQVKAEFCPNAPDGSLGKTLPLIFGENIHVDPVCIDEWNSTLSAPVWGYGTALGTKRINGYDTYYPGGVASYWVQDSDGEFKQVDNPATANETSYGNTSGSAVASGSTTNRVRRVNAWFIDTSSNKYIVHAGGVKYYDLFATPGGGFDEGGFKFAIAKNVNGKPGDYIETVEYSKNDFTWTGGLTARDVVFYFNRPIALTDDAGYFLVAEETSQSGYELKLVETTASTNTHYFKRNNNPDVWYSKTGQRNNFYWLNTLKFTDAYSSSASSNDFADPENFLSARYFYLEGSTSDKKPHTLNIKLKVNGIRDTASGDVSGVANAYIKNPVDIITLINGYSNGFDWTITNSGFNRGFYDNTFYSGVGAPISDENARYYREIQGAFRNKITRDEAIRAICAESACKYCYDPSTGKYGLYAWGTKLAPADTLNDFNSVLVSYQVEDGRRVVNSVSANYYENLIFEDVRYRPTLTQPEDPNLDGVDSARWVNALSFSPREESYPDDLLLNELLEYAGDSFIKYGAKVFSKFDFRLISDYQSMRALIEYIVRNGQNAHEYVTIEAPLDRFNHLYLMQKINLIYPQLPNLSGTSARPLPGINNAGNENIAGNTYEVKAPTMKGQIYGIRYDLSSKESKIVFTIRILNNSGDPT